MNQKISENLKKAFEDEPDSKQRVILLFKETEEAKEISVEDQPNREAAVKALKARAAISSEKFVESMKGAEANGFMNEDFDLKSNWLSNSAFATANKDLVEQLAVRDDIESIELNETVQLDEPVEDEEKKTVLTSEGAYEDDKTVTWGLKAINALGARRKYKVNGDGVSIGILDTGIDGNHPAFREFGKISKFKDFINGRDRPYDDNGHGTHCAGTIAGSSEHDMEFGVAPGCKLVVGKMLSGRGGGTYEQIARAMEWIATTDVKAVSNSWGANSQSEVFRRAVSSWVKLGILPVFAAGNSGPGRGSVGIPGGYPEALTVGATAHWKDVAWFSSRGPSRFGDGSLVKPDVCAPGHLVFSAWPGRSRYLTISGTSMATPHVAGMVALMAQLNKKLDNDELSIAIQKSTMLGRSSEKNNNWGWGQINCLKALRLVKG